MQIGITTTQAHPHSRDASVGAMSMALNYKRGRRAAPNHQRASVVWASAPEQTRGYEVTRWPSCRAEQTCRCEARRWSWQRPGSARSRARMGWRQRWPWRHEKKEGRRSYWRWLHGSMNQETNPHIKQHQGRHCRHGSTVLQPTPKTRETKQNKTRIKANEPQRGEGDLLQTQGSRSNIPRQTLGNCHVPYRRKTTARGGRREEMKMGKKTKPAPQIRRDSQNLKK